MSHNVFEENTFKYLLTSVNVGSRYKIARVYETKKASKVTFVLESIRKKGGTLKYPEVLQCGYGSEFKSVVVKLSEKHKVDI